MLPEITGTSQTYCPECDAVISLDDSQKGGRISGNKCGVELEIVQRRPLAVDYPYDGGWNEGFEDDEV